MRGEPDRAADLLERALEEGTHDEWTRALLHAGLGAVHVEIGNDDAARDAFREARAGFRAAADEANDVACAIGLAELELYGGDFDVAAKVVEPVLEWTRTTGDRYRGGGALYVLGMAELGRGRRAAGRAALAESLDLVLASERTGSLIFTSLLIAIAFAADPAKTKSAVRLRAAADRLSDEKGFVRSERDRELQERFRGPLSEAAARELGDNQHVGGGNISLEETIALAHALVRES